MLIYRWNVHSLSKYLKFICLVFLSLLLSCQQTVVKTYKDNNCEIFVAAKNGFWIDVFSKDLHENRVVFRRGLKDITIEKQEFEIGNIRYFINEDIKLTDTLTITYKEQIYKIYDFKNLKETSIDGKDHTNIGICRICTALINGELIQDTQNNVLRVVLE